MIEWYYLVIASAILSAIVQVIEKKILKIEHALTFSLALMFGVAIMSLFTIPFADFSSITSVQWLLMLAFSGTLALSYWLSAKMLRHSNISVAAPLSNALPILLVVILAFLFLGEVLTLRQYLAIIIMVIVSYIILGEVRHTNKSERTVKLYKRLVYAAVLVSAAAGILLKYTIQTMDIYTFFIITSIMTVVFLSYEMLGKTMTYKASSKMTLKKSMIPLLIIVGMTVASRLLFYIAIVAVPIALASPMSNGIIVMMMVLSGGFFFHERRMKWKILLSVVLVVAVYFLVV